MPLPSAKDSLNNSLRMRAGKMWVAFDKDALLRKRLVFPRVIIEEAVISADSFDGLVTQAVVDVPSAGGKPDIDFTAGPMVEFEPGESTTDKPEMPLVPESTESHAASESHVHAGSGIKPESQSSHLPSSRWCGWNSSVS